jgi:energy-coupling factor transporter ATPase
MKDIIQVENVRYLAPPERQTAILDRISLRIGDGEFVAMVGANGSGKTTLARHLNGLLLPDQGRVLVDGLDTRQAQHTSHIRCMVGMVFQSPEDQIVANTVEEDVAFGLENLALPPAEVRRRVSATLASVGIEPLRLRQPHQLSAGQMQRLALAGILAMKPRVIVCDESSSHLDPRGRKDLLSLLKSLHQEGITILLITHFMSEAAEAERLIVLQHGRLAMDGTPQTVFSDPAALHELGLELPPASALANRLRPWMPGLEANLLTSAQLLQVLVGCKSCATDADLPLQAPEIHRDSPVIDVVNLGFTYLKGTPLAQRALDQISMQMTSRRGHGLIGSTGSGKSTLLQHLNGLFRPQEGQVRVLDYDLNDSKVDLLSVRQKVGLAFQLPELYFFEQYVGDEIAFGPRQYGQKGLAQRVREAMEQVGLDFEGFKDRLVFTLSGGERRKVALASVLALQPKMMLLDEPLAGLDPRSRHETIAVLQSWQERGLKLLVSSHGIDDLVELVDDVTLVQTGRDKLSGSADQVFAQEDILAEAGVEAPLAAQAARVLRLAGWHIPLHVLLPIQLEDRLRTLTDPSEKGGAGE